MARIQLARSSSGGVLRPNVSVLVRTREAWSDSWRTQRYVVALTAVASVAPDIGTATFRYSYGRVREIDKSSFRDYEPLDIEGHFIQIKIAGGGAVLWTGVVTQEGFDQEGEEAAEPSGDQAFSAQEMGAFLDRRAVAKGYVKVAVEGEEDTYEAEGIGWLPSFNRRYFMGLGLAGNRSSEKLAAAGGGFEEAYAFAMDGEAWTQLDIVEYLLARLHPPGIEFGLSGQYEELDYVAGEQHLEGLSLWQALAHLIERRRGLGWLLEPGKDDEKLYVHVFATLGEPISVGDVTIPANGEQVSMPDISDSALYSEARLELSTQTRYERVVAVGERIKVCCTLSVAEATLEAAWSAAEEAAYKVGHTDPAGNSELNDKERQTDKFKRVYQAFRVPRDWDFLAGNGTGLDAELVDEEEVAWEPRLVVPSMQADGTIDEEEAATSWLGGKAFLRTLPLEKPAEAEGAEPEYVPILAVLKDPGTGKFVEASSIEENRMSVRPLDREMAIEVEPSGVNHILGLNHFAEAGNPPTDTAPVFDWESLIATVAFESDEKLACYAQSERYETAAHPRVLMLDVERAEGWYIVPGTVTGVTEGALDRYVDGEHENNLIRDDSARLRQAAALALAWYGEARAKMRLTWAEISGKISLGSYIKDVGDSVERREVGTVVTQKSWDFGANASTTIRTGFSGGRRGSVDFPGMSGPRALAREFRRLRREVHDLRANAGGLPARIATGGGGGGASGGATIEYRTLNAGDY